MLNDGSNEGEVDQRADYARSGTGIPRDIPFLHIHAKDDPTVPYGTGGVSTGLDYEIALRPMAACEFWAKHNGIEGDPPVPVATAKSTYTHYTWSNDVFNTPLVELYGVNVGGHTWNLLNEPNEPSTNEAIVNFFDRFRLSQFFPTNLDVNNDSQIDILDMVDMVNNVDSQYNISDVRELINSIIGV